MTDSTPRHGHAPINMERVANGSDVTKVGQFYFVKSKGGRSIVIAIPNKGAPKGWTLCEWTIDHKNNCGAQWSWNSDKVKPTLHPSLHWVRVWHGWCKGGQLIEA